MCRKLGATNYDVTFKVMANNDSPSGIYICSIVAAARLFSCRQPDQTRAQAPSFHIASELQGCMELYSSTVDSKLFVAFMVTEPMESHAYCLGPFGDDFAIGHPISH